MWLSVLSSNDRHGPMVHASRQFHWQESSTTRGMSLDDALHRTDGEMARGKYLEDFAALYGLKTITIADLVRYLEAHPEEALPATGAER